MSVNKVQLANGETIIDISDSTVTPETLAEGVTAHDASGTKITGTMKAGGGSVQSDWNQTDETAADFIKNKPFRVANLNFETFALDITPEEIYEVIIMGGCVLFAMTMTPLAVDTDIEAGGITAVYCSSSNVVVADGAGMIIGTFFSFSPVDGSFMGAQSAMWTDGMVMD